MLIGSRTSAEPILDPDLPIVDAHHHLWFQTAESIAAMEAHDSITARALAVTFRRHPRYLFDELLADLESGHNICATVHNDAHAMYRASGPEEMKSVGEVEFVNGVAAMVASGAFGSVKACAAIVGGVNLQLGSRVEDVLHAHIQAGGGRYRGVRTSALYDEDPSIFGANAGAPQLLLDPKFRNGYACLQRLGLSFDALVLEPQLPEVTDLAREFPEVPIVLNHLGCPVGVGRFAGKREERFPTWRENVRTLAQCENVTVKLGGLGTPFGGFKSVGSATPATSQQLAIEWKPYIETCIESFGVNRCMFESNFPIDAAAGSYRAVWNAFKRVCATASKSEKEALFSGTALRVYRLDA